MPRALVGSNRTDLYFKLMTPWGTSTGTNMISNLTVSKMRLQSDNLGKADFPTSRHCYSVYVWPRLQRWRTVIRKRGEIQRAVVKSTIQINRAILCFGHNDAMECGVIFSMLFDEKGNATGVGVLFVDLYLHAPVLLSGYQINGREQRKCYIHRLRESQPRSRANSTFRDP